MSSGIYKLGFCRSCRQNVHHFRGRKSATARMADLLSLYILNFGPWYCARCEFRCRCLPWTRRNEPTVRRIERNGEQVGNYLRSDSSLVMRKKRSGRYSKKFREGVVIRLLGGKTSIASLTTELKITESDLMAWINELLESRDLRIDELTSLLRSYHRAAADLIGIADATVRYDESENMVEGTVRSRRKSSSVNSDASASH